MLVNCIVTPDSEIERHNVDRLDRKLDYKMMHATNLHVRAIGLFRPKAFDLFGELLHLCIDVHIDRHDESEEWEEDVCESTLPKVPRLICRDRSGLQVVRLRLNEREKRCLYFIWLCIRNYIWYGVSNPTNLWISYFHKTKIL